MADEKVAPAVTEEIVQDVERLKKRLDMLDTRLDNIDSTTNLSLSLRRAAMSYASSGV